MLSVVNTVEISRDQSWSLNSTDQIVLGLLATSLMGWNDGMLCIYIYVCVCVCLCVYIYMYGERTGLRNAEKPRTI